MGELAWFKPGCHLRKSMGKLPRICALAQPYNKLEKFLAAKCAAKHVNSIPPLTKLSKGEAKGTISYEFKNGIITALAITV